MLWVLAKLNQPVINVSCANRSVGKAEYKVSTILSEITFSSPPSSRNAQQPITDIDIYRSDEGKYRRNGKENGENTRGNGKQREI